MRALLDVSMLVALHDPQHVHHEFATDWMEENRVYGWASCPLTQNGCVRVLSQPAYTNPAPLAALLRTLGRSVASAQHEFWPDDISLLDGSKFHHDRIHGHRQLTDLYLLALAVRRGGRLVTFDARIPLSAVAGATTHHLVTIAAS